MIDSAWKYWYRAMHDQRCCASGEDFENYVAQILNRFHDDYMNPDPMGRLGDNGCDGAADNGNIIYACYGSRAITDIDRKTTNKIEKDFARFIENWSDATTWRFITNSPIGPTTTKAIIKLRKEYGPESARPVRIEVWTSDDLWWEAAEKLTWEQLNQVIPGAPHSSDVELSDLVQVIESLDEAEVDLSTEVEPIVPVPATKMDYNRLHEATRLEFNGGRRLSPRIDRWFAEQPDPQLRDEKAKRFKIIYRQARQATSNPFEIAHTIYAAVGGPNFQCDAKRANAVYAVTVYFFDSCEIFETPPAEFSGVHQ